MIDIERLVRSGPCKKIMAGKRVTFLSGRSGMERAMYILVTGKVDIFSEQVRNELVPTGTVFPGGVFGGREFFLGSSDNIYIADIDSIVYILSEESFKRLATAHPDVLLEVLKAAYAPVDGYVSLAQEGPPAEDEAEEAASPALKVELPGFFPEGHKGYPGITKPEYINGTFKQEYTCPFCKKQFVSRKISHSKLYQSKPIRFDLRRFYRDFQPEWYEVVICPHCYFSMHYSYYLEKKRLYNDRIVSELAAARAAVWLDFEAERNLDFVFIAHYLALVCAPGYAASESKICAKIWGNLSWLYEDASDDEMMRMAAEKAAEAYEKVYMESHLTPVKEQVSCLSIAGMMYRAGKTDNGNVKKYLYRAKTISSGNKIYANLADELSDMIREVT